jgi:pimeloyl-ACP methyl ester carboxylesterase
VLAVLAAAGDRAQLVGHSLGAVCCLLAAMQSRSLRSLVLYEPPLRIDRLNTSIGDEMQAALDAGNPDRALEMFFTVAGIVETEAQVLRSLDPVWERLRAGVRCAPREGEAPLEALDRLKASDPPDVPTLYLYGQETDAPIFATVDHVAERLPKAQLLGLPGQRHLAFAFDPTSFAQAVLAFTTAHGD